jgi:uncharacterized protein involved in exopolysaccharide biosynthesis
MIRFFCILTLIFTPSLSFAAEATLRLSPESERYVVGEAFTIQLLVDTDSPVTAAEAEVVFTPAVTGESVSTRS